MRINDVITINEVERNNWKIIENDLKSGKRVYVSPDTSETFKATFEAGSKTGIVESNL